MLQRIVAVAVLCVAVVNAYSVTPTFGSDIGGLGVDRILGMAVDGTGAYYVVGSTTSVEFNTTLTAGGPAPTTTNVRANVFASGGVQGFVTKYGASGNRIWTATATGSGTDEVAAIALSADKVFVCGRSNGAVTLQGPAGDSFPLTNAGDYDVFIAAFDLKNGTCMWAVSGASAQEDVCNGIAYSSVISTVAVTGAWGMEAGTVTDFVMGGYILNPAASALANDYVGRLNALDGTNPGLSYGAVIPPGLSGEGFALGSLAPIGRALDFDSNGHLFQVSTAMDDGASTFLGPAGFNDIFLHVFSNLSMTDPATLANAANQNPMPWGFDQGSIHSAYMGSVNGDDYVTAIKVTKTGTDDTTDRYVSLANTRIAMAGYTKNGAGATFRFRAQGYGTNADKYPTALSAAVPSGQAPWFNVNNGLLNATAATGSATFYGTPSLMGWTGGMAYERVSGHFWIAGTWMGSASITVNGAATTVSTRDKAPDAVLMRVAPSGALQWVEVAGSAGNDTGVAAAVVVQGVGFNPTPRPVSFLAGWFPGNLTLSAASAAPLTLRQKANGDAFVVAYDDVDDCGLQAGLQPWGPNACDLSTDFNAIGGSLCLDEPGFPLCFCNMNVTDSTPGGPQCKRRGWNCAFMAPYYFGLLNVCNCPQLPNPSANPLLDVEGRLLLCAPTVCDFRTLTGTHATCLPLVLDLMSTCSALTAPTPLVDRGYIAAFQGLYANCPADPVSSTGAGGGTGAGSSGTIDFGSAPAAAAASTVVAGAAMFAGVALTAGAAGADN